MRFGAEHGADLVHALEHADHHLLVELRTLREVAGPAEVVDPEHVRTGLGGRRDDLRRLDLDEAGGVERGADARERERTEAEHRAAAGVAQGDRAVIELIRKLLLQLGHAQVHGRRLGCRDEPAERRVDELHSSGRLLVQLRRTLDHEHRLVEPLGGFGTLFGVVDDDLADAGAVSDDHEVDPRQRTVVEQPAPELDPLADVCGKLRGPDAHSGKPIAPPWPPFRSRIRDRSS